MIIVKEPGNLMTIAKEPVNHMTIAKEPGNLMIIVKEPGKFLQSALFLLLLLFVVLLLSMVTTSPLPISIYIFSILVTSAIIIVTQLSRFPGWQLAPFGFQRAPGWSKNMR